MMARPVNKVSVKGLRQTHFLQLSAYIDYLEETGWYQGNKTQFDKRHAELVEWIDGIIRDFEVSK